MSYKFGPFNFLKKRKKFKKGKMNNDNDRDRNRNHDNFKFDIGQLVKTPIKKTKMHREYWVNWDEEPKKIIARYNQYGINTYKLKNFINNIIPGTFQESQLQPINYDIRDKNSILRTKILQKDERNNRYRIHFLNWPAKYNKWVKAGDLYKSGPLSDRILPGP